MSDADRIKELESKIAELQASLDMAVEVLKKIAGHDLEGHDKPSCAYRIRNMAGDLLSSPPIAHRLKVNEAKEEEIKWRRKYMDESSNGATANFEWMVKCRENADKALRTLEELRKP